MVWGRTSYCNRPVHICTFAISTRVHIPRDGAGKGPGPWETNNFPNSEFILVVHRELFTATKYFRVAARDHTLAAPGTTVTFADEPVPSESCGAPLQGPILLRVVWPVVPVQRSSKFTDYPSHPNKSPPSIEKSQHGQPRSALWPRSVTAPRLRVAAVEGRGLPPRRRRPLQ